MAAIGRSILPAPTNDLSAHPGCAGRLVNGLIRGTALL